MLKLRDEAVAFGAPVTPPCGEIPRLTSPAVGNYLVLVGIIVALLLSSLLLARRVSDSVVRCGFCDHKVRPWAVRRETFTCRPCKKILPRRLAYPAPAPAGHPKRHVESGSVPVLATAGRHRKAA